MKRILSLLVVLLTMASTNLCAQSVIEPFENWTNYTVWGTSLSEPDNWSATDSIIIGYGKWLNPFGTYNKQVFQETSSNSGQFAMRAATKFQDGVSAAGLGPKDYPVIITNSNIIIDLNNGGFSQSGGTSINFSPTSTSMFVKNTVVGGDSTYIQAILIDDGDGADSIIAVADTALGANIGSFTQINLPFVYNGSTLIPNLVRYVISSGNPLAVADSTNTFVVHDGTEIIVDDIDLAAPLGISQHIYTSKICDVYPSLMNDYLQVNYIKQQNEKLELNILSSDGKLVKKYDLTNERNSLDVSELAAGTYVYFIANNANGQRIQSGKLQK